MKFKRQASVNDELNLTPLIDVVFLLLIFFMVSTTFTKETHLSIELPEADGVKSIEKTKQVEIVINALGTYTVNGRSLVNKKLNTLMAAMEEVSGGDHSMPMIITADASTAHQAVVRAMDAAGQLGFVHLSITTKQVQDDN